jgi:D-threo-aldose 1-dehydrogenase
MGYDPFERVPLGRSGLTLTRLGLGGASIGGLFAPVDDADAISTVRRAWDLGVRYFDVAPLYGYGAAERRFGAGLADRPREGYVLSTKVGRLVRDTDAIPPGTDIDRQAIDGIEDAAYADTAGRRIVFDYSGPGIRRSIEESLERLGVERIDLAFIHDPDDHWEQAIGEAYPALHRMRQEGLVTAIGVGMNQAEMLARFASDADVDALLVANRYTLLDQTALSELLPRCVERGIAVLIGGAMNSGVLADPRPGAKFDYAPAPPEVIARAHALGAACARHEVPLRAAAMQFPLAHPAVVGLIAGVRSVAHLDEYPALLRRPIPPALWADLRAEGLIHPDAPTPP